LKDKDFADNIISKGVDIEMKAVTEEEQILDFINSNIGNR